MNAYDAAVHATQASAQIATRLSGTNEPTMEQQITALTGQKVLAAHRPLKEDQPLEYIVVEKIGVSEHADLLFLLEPKPSRVPLIVTSALAGAGATSVLALVVGLLAL